MKRIGCFGFYDLIFPFHLDSLFQSDAVLRANFETRQSIFTKNDFACACKSPHTPHLYWVPGIIFRYLERTFQCPILQAILVDLPMKPRRPPSRAAIPLILSRLRAISRLTSLASSRNNLRVFIDAEGSPAHAGLFISSRSAWSFARYFSAHHSCTACPPPTLRLRAQLLHAGI